MTWLLKRPRVFRQPQQSLPSPLLHWFKVAKIYSAFEAGFSGFSLHRDHLKAGTEKFEVNVALIAVAANDKDFGAFK